MVLGGLGFLLFLAYSLIKGGLVMTFLGVGR
jgi:hypothetical protein